MKTKRIRKSALLQLKLDIQFGFDTEEEIFDNISFMFYNEERYDKCFDEEKLMQLISKYYKRHQRDSLNWQYPTDFDKLANAFDDLVKQNIICLHNVYNCEDGEADCLYAVDMLLKKDIKVEGFCYYNSYDLEQLIGSGEQSLLLRFKSLKLGIKQVTKIKNTILKTLTLHGLQSNVSDLNHNVIEIKNINWRKKPDQEDWWMDRVFSLLSKT
jgi:hypothetical protein